MFEEKYERKQEGKNQIRTIPGKLCEKDEDGNLRNCKEVELPIDEIRNCKK